MIANLSKGNILLLKVDNGLDYETKEKEIKQMKKESAIMNVVKNAIEAKNAGFEKATINFTTQDENGEKSYHTYFLNVASNGNVALNPEKANKDKDPMIWVNKFEKDDKVSYGFQKSRNADGQYVLDDKVAAFLDSVEVKEANDKSFVGVNVLLNDQKLKQELFAAQENGQKAYAVIKNNGEIRIEQGNAPKEKQADKQEPQQTIGNPNKQKQNEMER